MTVVNRIGREIAIGCDGTATNNGWKKGVIHNGKVINQPQLQWFIFLLHFNELPFRRLFEYLDGETKGQGHFLRNLANNYQAVWQTFPVVYFKTTESEEITVTKTDLTKDLQYLLYIVQAVQTGKCDHILL